MIQHPPPNLLCERAFRTRPAAVKVRDDGAPRPPRAALGNCFAIFMQYSMCDLMKLNIGKRENTETEIILLRLQAQARSVAARRDNSNQCKFATDRGCAITGRQRYGAIGTHRAY
ncbi:hypothetical protein EVAR_23105_1 [Eumeta japonica]|uniref:Uncharacterized protein n=1 Tax=Eumeta variegata TaxID=151549 RepID=A0A4C1VNP8_EUMVA|nr:hypothetical protein EVAR_23105_1 [Eumeta japonica]